MGETYGKCAHCGCEFLLTSVQVGMLGRANPLRVFCSPICRQSAPPKSGGKYECTCGACGKQFRSSRPKAFCNIKCYVASDQFKQHQAEISKKGLQTSLANRGHELKDPKLVECLNCGRQWHERPSRKSRYCNHKCYREYMAKRFDRWIASPQNIALPQAYDEFLLQEELPCLVDGCGWVGQNLSFHMNMTHGVPADEFKRAAGFNITTGVITSALSQKMSERPHLGYMFQERPRWQQEGSAAPAKKTKNYHSLESKEHHAKAFILREQTMPQSVRICCGCGKEFETTSIWACNTKYCSVACRDAFYKQEVAKREIVAFCGVCQKEFNANYYQGLRMRKGLPVFCSASCKGINNTQNRRYRPIKRDPGALSQPSPSHSPTTEPPHHQTDGTTSDVPKKP